MHGDQCACSRAKQKTTENNKPKLSRGDVFFKKGVLKNLSKCAGQYIFQIITGVLHVVTVEVQKMNFFINDFFSKCDQTPRKLQIWSHLLKQSLMENFIFCAMKILTSTNKFILNCLFKYMATVEDPCIPFGIFEML